MSSWARQVRRWPSTIKRSRLQVSQKRFDSGEMNPTFSPNSSAVAYPEVPDRLMKSDVLLLPLRDNLFGRRLTSPLKLWDYLAIDRPIVAPDLATVREIQRISGVRMHLHTPEDGDDLNRAVREALNASPRAPFVRTWAQRAEELESLL